MKKVDTDRCKGILAIRSAIPVVEREYVHAAIEELEAARAVVEAAEKGLVRIRRLAESLAELDALWAGEERLTFEVQEMLSSALATYRKAVGP